MMNTQSDDRRSKLLVTSGAIVATLMLIGALFGGFFFLDDRYVHKSDRRALESAVPSGIISMWSGSINDIPEGWVLCDGSYGTPDLRDRFILGSVSEISESEKTGGGSTSLVPENMPSHSHSITHQHANDLAIEPVRHQHQYRRTRTDAIGSLYEGNAIEEGGDRGLWTGDSVSVSSTELAISGTVGVFDGASKPAGSESPQPIEIVPRYYKMAFIMKKYPGD